jgi:outer membrane protein
MRNTFALLLLSLTAPAWADGAAPRVVNLAEAIRTAREHQPQLRQAYAGTEAAYARVDEARAPLLPQVTGTAIYRRATSNFAPSPGSVPRGLSASSSPSFGTVNSYNFGLTASLLLWDFGQARGRWRAAEASAQAQKQSESFTRLGIVFGARSGFLTARAQKDLVKVARDTLANQERHLGQIQGFVEVGTRPPVDLAQARADRANAQVQLINAENNYAVAKAQLNQAMGIEGDVEYEVADDGMQPIAGEDLSTEGLMAEAVRARPDITSLDTQIRAQELTLGATRGAYLPTLSASTGVTEAGAQLDNMVWNWNASLNLTWQFYQGGLTSAQVDEARANLKGLVAQRDALRQTLRVGVEQARLGLRAAKASLSAAEEALTNARERLKLAEGRYQVGVGTLIELGDAQLAYTNTAAQKVQADYNLANTRAQLLQALGRE